jgi:small conductance mechanosensitive channel
MEKADVLLEKAIEFITYYGPKVLGAILIYIIGSWLVKKMTLGLEKVLSKSKYDVTLQKFFHNLLYWTLKIVIILLVISTLGIDVTAFQPLLRQLVWLLVWHYKDRYPILQVVCLL